MFTGIITGTGTVLGIENHPNEDLAVLTLKAPGHTEALGLGGSLAVNGVCLTATELEGETLSVDVMGETLRRTSTGELRAGSIVNLERCTPAGGRLDGHVVQGHVDTVGTVLAREDHGQWTTFRIGLPDEYAPLTAEKGSIALDGISLTITAVSAATATGAHWVEVGIIPITLEETTMGSRQVGDAINIEVDVLAKYVARLNAFGGGK
ncbi:riboflavin synthase [Arthrobacter sp. MYb211]|uniref:riboflavin synthase n=1 Tax=Micrococcaceae TaxID=1268 RepID=UPI000CFAAE13|nr:MULTISPECIES: riboflavin synthase [unclassified Arthrobacter]PRA06418.1 riboflavin synthase [Arthrobacter sp. MYb229]PRA12651.1 riboflavin synthase [Arthrobacter sp. MYb221]PRB53320.1 riboflavin synthase [Arthrobacter sp. MYb216]PRC09829.1 riboflavin synthase [Arthrobacter sp. MYb211]